MFTKTTILKYNAKWVEKLIFILVVLNAVLQSLKLLLKKNLAVNQEFKLFMKQCYLIV